MLNKFKKIVREIIAKLEEDGKLTKDELIKILTQNKYTFDKLKKWAGYKK